VKEKHAAGPEKKPRQAHKTKIGERKERKERGDRAGLGRERMIGGRECGLD